MQKICVYIYQTQQTNFPFLYGRGINLTKNGHTGFGAAAPMGGRGRRPRNIAPSPSGDNVIKLR